MKRTESWTQWVKARSYFCWSRKMPGTKSSRPCEPASDGFLNWFLYLICIIQLQTRNRWGKVIRTTIHSAVNRKWIGSSCLMEVDVLCESSDSAAGAVDLLRSSERQHWWESCSGISNRPPTSARPLSSKQVFLAARREMKPGRPQWFTVATSVLNKIVSDPQTQNPAWSCTKMIAQSRKTG